MTWVLENLGFIAELAGTHLVISLWPSVIGFIFAVVLAKVISKRLSTSVSALMATIYAIPSLALFVTLPAILGTPYTGSTNVIIALTLYFFSSMFFSARDSFAQVPEPVSQFADAQGFSAWQKFIQIELPLALPGLIAGLRVSVASTISMASIAAVVGVRNLGFLFLDGFQRKIPEEIFAGLLAIAFLAIAFDLALWRIGLWVTPWAKLGAKRA